MSDNGISKEEIKALKKRFKKKLTAENSKRFVIMLGCVSAALVALIGIQLLGVVESSREFLYVELGSLSVCILFSFILTRMRKMAEKKHNTNLLSAIKTILHLFLLAIGFYLTIYMYSIGIYSFTAYIITSFIISITHIRWPYLFNMFYGFGFIGLVIYIQQAFAVPEYYIDETHVTFLLMVLIGLGNVLNYEVRWKLFLKERKVFEINQKLVEISQIDELTGLFNRRKVLDELDNIIDFSRDSGRDFCVVMVDLDNFKKVNDKFGHNTGDTTLRSFANLIKSNLRKNDIFARWGGEEFLVIIPDSKKDDAFKLIDRIRKIVEIHDFEEVGRLTFSAGICEYMPEYTDDKLIGNADFALYTSKNMGRNQVKVYSKM